MARARRRTNRAFREFLTLPVLIVVAYGALAVGSVAVDKAAPHWLRPLLAPCTSSSTGGPRRACCPCAP